MIFTRFFSLRYILLILLLTPLSVASEKSSSDIQKNIDSRNEELKYLRSEIKDIEERLIRKTRDAISSTEILINLENKISLTGKLIRSLHKEEQYISGVIRDTEVQITKMEIHLAKLKRQLTQRLQYIYIHGRPGVLETILLADDWNSAIYRIKYLDVLAEYEKKLRQQMKETMVVMERKKVKREIELNRKTALLTEKKSEGSRLENDKKQRQKVLGDIKREKSKLEKNRSIKTQMITEMEQLIKKLYEDKEAVKKREEELARIRAAQHLATTGNFAKMRGKLSWPIEGRIISKFGTILIKWNITFSFLFENHTFYRFIEKTSSKFFIKYKQRPYWSCSRGWIITSLILFHRFYISRKRTRCTKINSLKWSPIRNYYILWR